MKNKKIILFSLLLLIIVLSACESEQPGFLIVEKQGTTITTSITNNITNNITTGGSNITNNYTLGNTSFSCNDANDYLYNVSVLNGQLTGVCAADSTGGGGDGTGGWTNTTIVTSTGLQVNITGLTQFQTNAFFPVGAGIWWGATGQFTDGIYKPTSSSMIIRVGSSSTGANRIQINGSTGFVGIGVHENSAVNQRLQVNGSTNITNTTYTNFLTISNNTATSCDLKADTNGNVYCGTDSAGSISNYSILLDAQYNITNQIWLNLTDQRYNETNLINSIATNLQSNITSVNISSVQKTDFNTQNLSIVKEGDQNRTSVSCSNITGATSNLCTITSGGGSSSQIPLPNRQSTYIVYATEMLTRVQAGAVDPFGIGAISSGTTAARNGNRTHPGIITFLSSTTASSGGYISTDITAFLINGTEEYTAVIMPQSKTGNLTITWLGFMDVISAATPTDMVAFNLTNFTITGTTRNNGVPTRTENYNITFGQWYILKIWISPSLDVNFTIRNATGSDLWSRNITRLTIPATIGREVGAGITSYVNGGTTAQNLIDVDYLEIGMNRTLYR